MWLEAEHPPGPISAPRVRTLSKKMGIRERDRQWGLECWGPPNITLYSEAAGFPRKHPLPLPEALGLRECGELDLLPQILQWNNRPNHQLCTMGPFLQGPFL